MTRRNHLTIKTYIVVPDLHVPFHDPSYIALTNLVVKKLKPDGIIQLGDALDFWQVSKYEKNPLRKQTIGEDAALYKVILQQWADLLPVTGVIHQLEGNHEDRLRRYVWANAKELAGLVQTVQEMIGLRDLGIRTIWHPIGQWDSCKIGDAVCHHGHFFNMHAAAGNLIKYPKSLITGHTHRFQYVSNGTRFSCTLGHGSNESETAHQPTPTGWQQAFGVLTVASGRAHLEPVLVHDGECVLYGKRLSV